MAGCEERSGVGWQYSDGETNGVLEKGGITSESVMTYDVM